MMKLRCIPLWLLCAAPLLMAQLQVKNSAETPVMTITQGGLTGIGTSEPSSTLHVSGSVRLEGLPPSATNTTLLSVDNEGNVAESAWIDLDEKVKASGSDPAAGYLGDKVANSVIVSGEKVQLSGDEAAPGNFKYYGTATAADVKGFFTLGGVARGQVDPGGTEYAELVTTGTTDDIPNVTLTVPVTGTYLVIGHYNVEIRNASAQSGAGINVLRGGSVLKYICNTDFSFVMSEISTGEILGIQKGRSFITTLTAGDVLQAIVGKWGTGTGRVRGYSDKSSITLVQLAN